mgnify:CR=1 FL=1
MNALIDIVLPSTVKDEEGFSTQGDSILASVRAYREGRHGTQKWANRAAFSEATDLFRFRTIPNLAITTGMAIICDNERFDITSVEDVSGRSMYVEVLAIKVEGASG